MARLKTCWGFAWRKSCKISTNPRKNIKRTSTCTNRRFKLRNDGTYEAFSALFSLCREKPGSDVIGHRCLHYDDVIMTILASHITSLTVVYSIVYSGVNQRKHQSSASLAFVREIHRGPVNFPHKWPVTRKMFPFDDVIMLISILV